jgi:hypothetical protein
MTFQEPTNRPQTSTGPARLFGLITGALVVALTIVAIIALFNALNRGPVSRTGTGPQHHAVST